MSLQMAVEVQVTIYEQFIQSYQNVQFAIVMLIKKKVPLIIPDLMYAKFCAI